MKALAFALSPVLALATVALATPVPAEAGNQRDGHRYSSRGYSGRDDYNRGYSRSAPYGSYRHYGSRYGRGIRGYGRSYGHGGYYAYPYYAYPYYYDYGYYDYGYGYYPPPPPPRRYCRPRPRIGIFFRF